MNDDEKKAALLDGAKATLGEMRRREPELAEMRRTAQAVFAALVTAPTLHIVESPKPEGMDFGGLWSVTPKVTVE